MRYVYSILLLLAAAYFLPSCCTKKACSTELNLVDFYNFTAEELDTVYFISYVKGANFNKALDTAVAYNSYTGNNPQLISTEMNFYPGNDYKVIVPGAGKEITITDITMKKIGCNSCFPYRPAGEYFDVLDSYELDGQSKVSESSNRIEIYK